VELLGVGEPVAHTDLTIPLQDELTDVVAIRGRIVRAQEGKALPLLVYELS
jgi:predicted fused transcriptional regulator/phosphomethylpyrimidine kinase